MNTDIRTRKYASVTDLHIELMSSLNKRLEDYCELFGRSKRFIVEDALLVWLNQRDMEISKREEATK